MLLNLLGMAIATTTHEDRAPKHASKACATNTTTTHEESAPERLVTDEGIDLPLKPILGSPKARAMRSTSSAIEAPLPLVEPCSPTKHHRDHEHDREAIKHAVEMEEARVAQCVARLYRKQQRADLRHYSHAMAKAAAEVTTRPAQQ